MPRKKQQVSATDLVTLESAADQLGISKRMLRYYAGKGEIPFYNLGTSQRRILLFTKALLKEYSNNIKEEGRKKM